VAEYTKRDIIELDKLGGHYSRHVSVMTVEHLHSKSDIAAELAWRDAELARLREALEFYADPDTYFAVGFMFDPPTGDFADDFDDTDLGRKPGKRAREALGK
jgi:hypothetical protein